MKKPVCGEGRGRDWRRKTDREKELDLKTTWQRSVTQTYKNHELLGQTADSGN